MGINVRVQNYKETKEIPSFEAKLERDLRSCMKCRFFYGHNSQCVANECVKEVKKQQEEENKESLCYECPYKQSEQYCFPCMKKTAWHGSKGTA